MYKLNAFYNLYDIKSSLNRSLPSMDRDDAAVAAAAAGVAAAGGHSAYIWKLLSSPASHLLVRREARISVRVWHYFLAPWH